MQKPEIPIRDSSKREHWHQRQLTLRASKQDLKRKLSTISFSESPINYSRLKIEELEAEQDDERHQKRYLDLEFESKAITAKDFRRQHGEANRRIVSLGDEKWKHSQALRALEEKQGRVQPLGPDSEGAYVAAMLKLYKDPRKSAKRDSSVQTAMRNDAIAKYEPGKGAEPDKFWCPISKDYYDCKNVVAAHIVPSRLGPELMDYTFGHGSGSRLFAADNCLLIQKGVEEHFDAGHFVLIPADRCESPIKRWKIHVTNESCLNSDMGRKRVKDFDGTEVEFKNEVRPAARFLYYHFIITLLRNKHYRCPGWERSLETLIAGQPFATPGRYLRASMLLVLARKIGDLSAEEEGRLYDTDLVFNDNEGLTPREEDEIARQCLEATTEATRDEGPESSKEDEIEREDQ